MFGSKNSFFKQPKEVLENKRSEVESLLKFKGYLPIEISIYLKAYDYFCINTLEFDGATIVNDLNDIIDLDLDAMLHDYHYVYYKVGTSFRNKWRADQIYMINQIRKGKGLYSSISRFIGLTISSIFFVPYTKFKKTMSKEEEEHFIIDYLVLKE